MNEFGCSAQKIDRSTAELVANQQFPFKEIELRTPCEFIQFAFEVDHLFRRIRPRLYGDDIICVDAHRLAPEIIGSAAGSEIAQIRARHLESACLKLFKSLCIVAFRTGDNRNRHRDAVFVSADVFDLRQGIVAFPHLADKTQSLCDPFKIKVLDITPADGFRRFLQIFREPPIKFPVFRLNLPAAEQRLHFRSGNILRYLLDHDDSAGAVKGRRLMNNRTQNPFPRKETTGADRIACFAFKINHQNPVRAFNHLNAGFIFQFRRHRKNCGKILRRYAFEEIRRHDLLQARIALFKLPRLNLENLFQ